MCLHTDVILASELVIFNILEKTLCRPVGEVRGDSLWIWMMDIQQALESLMTTTWFMLDNPAKLLGKCIF